MMPNVRIHRIVHFILFFWLLASGPAAGAPIDRIVAVVNEDIITLSELTARIEPVIEQIKARNLPSEQERKMLFSVRENALNQLIDQKLTDQEIKRAGISVSEAEIDNTLERIKESRFVTDEELREVLADQGMSMEQYRNHLKEQILRTKLITLEVKSKIVITQQDIKTYYESHPEHYGGEKKYHLRNIVIRPRPPANDREKQAVRDQMESMIERFKKGEPFASLASRYSQSPLAAEGGDLGLFKLEDLSVQIREAVQGLKAGEITPILDTDQGYQVVYIEGIRQTEGKPLEAVSGEIREKIFNEIVDQKFKSWLEALRQKSHIKAIK